MNKFNQSSAGCAPAQIHSWIDLQKICPIDPLELIANASIGGVAGTHIFSSKYIDPGTGWAACTATINSEVSVSALETTNEQMVADASQWNFSHITWDGSSSVAIPLRSMIFLRGGSQWSNSITFNSGGAAIQDIEISFLLNAATRGDKQGRVPVLQWTGLGLTTVQLDLTLHHPVSATLGIWLYNGTNHQMLALDILAIA